MEKINYEEHKAVETFDEYQHRAFTFRVPEATPEERVMGLMEESGEVAGVFKRLLRGDFNPDVAATKLHKELGDILWYLSQIAVDNGWKLSEIAAANLDKLEGRAIRGTIIGSGSER